MSILTDLINKKITFSQAAQQAEQWAENLVKANPNATADANNLLTAVKQGASDAVVAGDSALKDTISSIVSAGEPILDGALLKATGGLAPPAVPLVNQGVEAIANAARSMIDAWELKVKGGLGTTTAAQPAPPAPPQS